MTITAQETRLILHNQVAILYALSHLTRTKGWNVAANTLDDRRIDTQTYLENSQGPWRG